MPERNITIADIAREAGVSKTTPYRWMEEDPGFKAQVEQANEIGAECNLLPVAINRARDGWDEPVFHKGEECGMIRRFDNNLLWKLIQAKIKAYRPPTAFEVGTTEGLAAIMASIKDIPE